MVESASDMWLCEEVIKYAQDDEHRYAVAIEGVWGSGKTRFVNSVLAPALKKAKKRLVRISMFGIKNADELYKKIGAALLRIEGEDEDEGKIQQVARKVAKNLPNLTEAALSAIGISVQLDVGMKFAVDMLASEKHVIVFDDVERRSKDADDLSLSGAVNELVEGRGIKAVFVIGEKMEEGEESKRFDRAVREKLVWKAFRYEQNIDALVRSLFEDIVPPIPEIDIVECVREAAMRVQCANARAMLKAKVFICDLLKVEALRDRAIYGESLRSALTDIAEFALLTCEGRAPKKPEASQDKESNKFSDRRWRAEQEYLRYSDFPCIELYFRLQNSDAKLDIDGDLRSYIAKRYPDSEGAYVINEANSALWNISILSDGELLPLVSGLSSVVKKRAFSPSLLRSVVIANMRFLELGFEEAVSKEDLVNCCKEVLRKDYWGAFEFSRYRGAEISGGEQIDAILNDLSSYAFEVYSQELSSRTKDCVLNQGPAVEILEILERSSIIGVRGFLSINPDDVAWAFLNLAPEGQEELRLIVKKACLDFGVRDEEKGECAQWFSKLRQSLSEREDGDRLTRMRKGWFIQNIDEELERYERTK